MDVSQLITIAVAIFSGGVGSYVSTRVALAVVANDIQWLKDSLKRAHSRIDEVEKGFKPAVR